MHTILPLANLLPAVMDRLTVAYAGEWELVSVSPLEIKPHPLQGVLQALRDYAEPRLSVWAVDAGSWGLVFSDGEPQSAQSTQECSRRARLLESLRNAQARRRGQPVAYFQIDYRLLSKMIGCVSPELDLVMDMFRTKLHSLQQSETNPIGCCVPFVAADKRITHWIGYDYPLRLTQQEHRAICAELEYP